MIDLPQELLDEIIGHLSTHAPSLRNCSLVAKSWLYPSRSHLFDVVNVQHVNTLKSWWSNISPENTELLQHVRLLHCRMPNPSSSSFSLANCVNFLTEYSSSLRQLKHLSLTSGCISSFNQFGTPSAFQHTLAALVLVDCGVTINILATLVNYFYNLVHLNLVNLQYLVDAQPASPLSRPLRKLSVGDFHPVCNLVLIDLLSGLQLQSEEVTIRSFLPSPSLAQRVINGVEASVRYLDLQKDLKCAYSSLGSCLTSYSTKYRHSIIVIGNPLTLSSCRELREVKICASPPETMEQDLLSSITSTHIEKIALNLGRSFRKLLPDHAYWGKLDRSLCHLADRLGCEGRLEVTIQIISKDGELEYDYGKYLPMFHGKGRVRVVGVTGTLLYCSSGTGQS